MEFDHSEDQGITHQPTEAARAKLSHQTRDQSYPSEMDVQASAAQQAEPAAADEPEPAPTTQQVLPSSVTQEISASATTQRDELNKVKRREPRAETKKQIKQEAKKRRDLGLEYVSFTTEKKVEQ